MFGKKKKNDTKEEKTDNKEISFDELDNVSAGGAFSGVPRVPEKPIDDNLKDKA